MSLKNPDYPLMQDEANFLKFVREKNHRIKKPLMIDVGCNIGDFTQGFLNIFPEARCILIDPSLDAIVACKNRFKENNNIKFFNFGLGEKEEELDFFDSGINTGCSSFYARYIYGKIENIAKYKVKIKTYDSLFKNKNIFYLKLDVEGYEYNIMKGASESLKKGLIKYIQFEYGLCMSEKEIEYSNLIPFLYDKYNIINGNYKEISENYDKEPINIFNGVLSGVENFLAIRKE